MRSLLALMKKEITEQIRTGTLMILGMLFVLFGIMNPAVAKLTPWLLETMAESLAQSGMIVTEVTVTAMDSWVQFFKNIPMGLIAFVLLEGGIFTREYQTGTLVLSLTKGLDRYKVVVSKTFVLTVLWTAAYWLCFGITYVYNGYFWDNTVAQNLYFSVVCWWLFGLWTVMLMVLFSVLATANTGVLVGTAGVVGVSSLLGLFPQISEYLPTRLTDGNLLIYGTADVETYTASLMIAAACCLTCFVISLAAFNKKRI